VRALLSAILVALLVTLTPASPASAAESYVTKPEFKKVKKHTKLTKVHGIFDTKGKQTSYYGAIDGGYCADGDLWACASQTRDYRTKSKWGTVTVTYYKRFGVWRVDSKYVYWG